MEPPHKRARLAEFGRDSYLTSAALSAVLKKLAEEDLPEHCSASTHRRAIQDIAHQQSSFGNLLQLVKVPASKKGT
eukprot:7372864-Pyramimonas_sp.AAC.1